MSSDHRHSETRARDETRTRDETRARDETRGRTRRTRHSPEVVITEPKPVIPTPDTTVAVASESFFSRILSRLPSGNIFLYVAILLGVSLLILYRVQRNVIGAVSDLHMDALEKNKTIDNLVKSINTSNAKVVELSKRVEELSTLSTAKLPDNPPPLFTPKPKVKDILFMEVKRSPEPAKQQPATIVEVEEEEANLDDRIAEELKELGVCAGDTCPAPTKEVNASEVD